MTTITVFVKDDRITGFRAKGHSGYAQRGEDIVCAAVSALTQTACMGLTELVKADAVISQKDGELRLEIPEGLEPEKRDKAELLLRMMLMGLRSVEKDYSDYLKIIKKEVKA